MGRYAVEMCWEASSTTTIEKLRNPRFLLDEVFWGYGILNPLLTMRNRDAGLSILLLTNTVFSDSSSKNPIALLLLLNEAITPLAANPSQSETLAHMP